MPPMEVTSGEMSKREIVKARFQYNQYFRLGTFLGGLERTNSIYIISKFSGSPWLLHFICTKQHIMQECIIYIKQAKRALKKNPPLLISSRRYFQNLLLSSIFSRNCLRHCCC